MMTPSERPTSVTAIGWIFIAAAGLMILSSGMVFMVFPYMKGVGGGRPPVPAGMPWHFRTMSILFEYFELLAFLQAVFAIFVLIAGIQFLQLRAWARTALEVVSWLGLVYLIGFGIFWIYGWITTASSIPAAAGIPRTFTIFGAVMGAVITAAWAVPLIVVIRHLRGPTISEAVSRR